MNTLEEIALSKKQLPHKSSYLNVIPLGLWLLSLLTTAFTLKGGTTWKGWEILVYGWAGLFELCPAWFTNIFFFRLMYLNRNSHDAKKIISNSYWLLILSLTAFYYDGASGEFTYSNIGKIRQYNVGFFLWLLAMSTSLILSAYHLKNLKEIYQHYTKAPEILLIIGIFCTITFILLAIFSFYNQI